MNWLTLRCKLEQVLWGRCKAGGSGRVCNFVRQISVVSWSGTFVNKEQRSNGHIISLFWWKVFARSTKLKEILDPSALPALFDSGVKLAPVQCHAVIRRKTTSCELFVNMNTKWWIKRQKEQGFFSIVPPITLFLKGYFFRSRLNILIFMLMLRWKYSCDLSHGISVTSFRHSTRFTPTEGCGKLFYSFLWYKMPYFSPFCTSFSCSTTAHGTNWTDSAVPEEEELQCRAVVINPRKGEFIASWLHLCNSKNQLHFAPKN